LFCDLPLLVLRCSFSKRSSLFILSFTLFGRAIHSAPQFIPASLPFLALPRITSISLSIRGGADFPLVAPGLPDQGRYPGSKNAPLSFSYWVCCCVFSCLVFFCFEFFLFFFGFSVISSLTSGVVISFGNRREGMIFLLLLDSQWLQTWFRSGVNPRTRCQRPPCVNFPLFARWGTFGDPSSPVVAPATLSCFLATDQEVNSPFCFSSFCVISGYPNSPRSQKRLLRHSTEWSFRGVPGVIFRGPQWSGDPNLFFSFLMWVILSGPGPSSGSLAPEINRGRS